MEQLKESKVTTLPEMTIAYLQHIGSYNEVSGIYGIFFQRLFEWAQKNDIMRHNPLSIVIHYDDPEVTPEDKQRLRVCLSVPPETKVEGEIGKTIIPSGTFFIGRFELQLAEIAQAWNWIYGEWFPASGYKPVDAVPFQVYPSPPVNGNFIIDFYIPVEKV